MNTLVDDFATFIVVLFEPLFVYLGERLLAIRSRHEDKSFELPEGTDEEDKNFYKFAFYNMSKKGYGQLVEDAIQYGNESAINDYHQNMKIKYWYEGIYYYSNIINKKSKYYFITD